MSYEGMKISDMIASANTTEKIDIPIGQCEIVPGRNEDQFILKFAENFHWRINDIIYGSDGIEVKVVKIYRFNLFRRILWFFGIPFKYMNCVKVEKTK